MSEQSSQEPTMEEILASIRRIISEDDAAAAEAKAAAKAGPPAAEAPAEPAAEATPLDEEAPPPATEGTPDALEDEEDALELTDKVETHGDLDVYTPSGEADAGPEPEPEPEPEPLPDFETPAAAATAAAAPLEPEAPLLSERAASAAASAFDRLSQTISMPAEGRTLEDVVRELLRPMLQQWLDDHLPGIVQASVDAEVERIARGRVR